MATIQIFAGQATVRLHYGDYAISPFQGEEKDQCKFLKIISGRIAVDDLMDNTLDVELVRLLSFISLLIVCQHISSTL